MTSIDSWQSVCLDGTILSQDSGGGGFPIVGIGRSLARFDGKVGRPVPIVTHIALIPRLLGHGVRPGYPKGLTHSARSLGYAREATWKAIGR
jgi:hypothetical protein